MRNKLHKVPDYLLHLNKAHYLEVLQLHKKPQEVYLEVVDSNLTPSHHQQVLFLANQVSLETKNLQDPYLDKMHHFLVILTHSSIIRKKRKMIKKRTMRMMMIMLVKEVEVHQPIKQQEINHFPLQQELQRLKLNQYRKVLMKRYSMYVFLI